MNLHNEIMNIQTDTNDQLSYQHGRDHSHTSYKLGHRDARHAAAELSLKYQAYIEELEQIVEIYGHEAGWQVNLDELKKECGL